MQRSLLLLLTLMLPFVVAAFSTAGTLSHHGRSLFRVTNRGLVAEYSRRARKSTSPFPAVVFGDDGGSRGKPARITSEASSNAQDSLPYLKKKNNWLGTMAVQTYVKRAQSHPVFVEIFMGYMMFWHSLWASDCSIRAALFSSAFASLAFFADRWQGAIKEHPEDQCSSKIERNKFYVNLPKAAQAFVLLRIVLLLTLDLKGFITQSGITAMIVMFYRKFKSIPGLKNIYEALFYAYDAAVLPVVFDSGVNPIRLDRALTIFLFQSTVEMIFDCPDSMDGNVAVFPTIASVHGERTALRLGVAQFALITALTWFVCGDGLAALLMFAPHMILGKGIPYYFDNIVSAETLSYMAWGVLRLSA